MFEVEFIGGPYDGHQGFLSSEYPAEELAWMVCEDVYRLLAGRERRNRGTMTSVAIYELDVVDGLFQYRFLRAISVNELTDSVRATGLQMTDGGNN